MPFDSPRFMHEFVDVDSIQKLFSALCVRSTEMEIQAGVIKNRWSERLTSLFYVEILIDIWNDSSLSHPSAALMKI